MKNEVRLIDANALPVKYWSRTAQMFADDIVCAVGTSYKTTIAEAENKALHRILSTIEHAPTVNAVPVVHRRWEKKHDNVCYWYECSDQQYIEQINVMEAEYSHIRHNEAEWEAMERAKDLFSELSELQDQLNAMTNRCVAVLNERDAAQKAIAVAASGRCCSICVREACHDRGMVQACTAFVWDFPKNNARQYTKMISGATECHSAEAKMQGKPERHIGWISVKDALPAKKLDIDGDSYYIHVLAFTTDEDIPQKIMFYDSDIKAWTEVGHELPTSETVTHWMPLPKPPKEDKA